MCRRKEGIYLTSKKRFLNSITKDFKYNDDFFGKIYLYTLIDGNNAFLDKVRERFKEVGMENFEMIFYMYDLHRKQCEGKYKIHKADGKSIEETILNDCFDWAENVEDWTYKSCNQIAEEIKSRTSIRLNASNIGKTLRNCFAYRKGADITRFRIIRGISYYNTPRIIRK